MIKFFGRYVDPSGIEVIAKMGSKYPNYNDSRHFTCPRDGQVTKIMPLGYHTGTRLGHSLALIKFPGISYKRIGGRLGNNWKLTDRNYFDYAKYFTPKDKNGKHQWEYKGNNDNVGKRNSDYFVDFYELMQKGYITLAEYERLYDFSTKSGPIIIPDSSFDEIFHHEDGDHKRINIEADTKHASVTTGTYSIGSGLDYDDIMDAIDDIGTPLTGNLTFEHASEETPYSTTKAIDTQTSGYLLKFTAASGAEHNGGAYGNGARINFTSYQSLYLNETSDGYLDDVEISKLAFDISGDNNEIDIINGGDSGLLLINRCLIKCDQYTSQNGSNALGLSDSAYNAAVRNCIIYGASKTGVAGIEINALFYGVYNTHVLYNNTIVKCYNGIRQASGVLNSATVIVKNNLVQGSTNSDYVDDGGGFGTSAKNYDEDGSGPDSLTGNFHDGTSNFIDYNSDDYRIDSGGDAIDTLKAGEDLTGTFTDDIDGDTRTSGEFFIGADWIDTGGGNVTGVHTNLDCQTDPQSHTGAVDVIYQHTNFDDTVELLTHVGYVDVVFSHTNIDCQTDDQSHSFEIDIFGVHTNIDCQTDIQTHIGAVDVIYSHINLDDTLELLTHTGYVDVVFPHTNIDCIVELLTHVGQVGGNIIGTHTNLDCITDDQTHIGAVDVIFQHTNLYNTVELLTHVGYVDIVFSHIIIDCQIDDQSHSFEIDIFGVHTNLDCQMDPQSHTGAVDVIFQHTNLDDTVELFTHTGYVDVTVDVTGTHINIDCQTECLVHSYTFQANYFENITNNLKNTFDGQSITYNSQTKTITCERERTVNVIDNRYPFVKLSGPIVDVLHRSRRKAQCDLHYLVEFIDNSIDDSYDPNLSVDPITKVLGSVEADLMVLAMADRERGGFANNTEWEGAGYYFDDSDGVSLFVKWLQLRVEVNVLESDPHFR